MTRRDFKVAVAIVMFVLAVLAAVRVAQIAVEWVTPPETYSTPNR